MDEQEVSTIYETEGDTGEEVQTEQEEMFELIAGKNPDGSPVKKSLKRDELLKFAQKGFGADKQFEEVAATKKQMTELARMLQDPEMAFEVLKKFGHDVDGLMTGRMARNMIEALKSPEEIEMETYKRDAEEYRRMMSDKRQREEEEQISSKAEQIRTSLYTRIEETLNSAGVRPTKSTVAEVARYIKQQAAAMERAGQDFDIETVKLPNIVAHLKNQYKSTIESLFDELDEDGILATLPEALQRKIGAALTKKLSGANANINVIERKKTERSVFDDPAPKSKMIDSKEARAIIEQRIAKAQRIWENMNKGKV